jgi:hypothetical protein
LSSFWVTSVSSYINFNTVILANQWASKTCWITSSNSTGGLLFSSFNISTHFNIPTQPLSDHGTLNVKQDTNKECKCKWWELMGVGEDTDVRQLTDR